MAYQLTLPSGEPIKRIMLNDIQILPSDYRFDFRDWIINTEVGHVIEVTNCKIIIKKFLPNRWIIKSNYKLSTSTDTTGICAKTKSLVISVSGLSNKMSTIFPSYYSHHSIVAGSGSTYGYIRGLGFMPFATGISAWVGDSYPDEGMQRGELPYTGYVWDSLTKNDGTKTQVGSELTLRGAGNGYNRYGIQADCTNKTIIPDWKSFPTPYSNWEMSIGLYTGTKTATGEDGLIDISDDPIIISIANEVGIDPSSIECWEIKDNEGNIVYHKDRTVENYILRYGIGTWKDLDENIGFNRIIINNKSVNNELLKLRETTDLWSDPKTLPKFNCKLGKPENWNFIKEYYETNGISLSAGSYLFQNSNIPGEFTIKVLTEFDDMPDFAYNCSSLTTVHIINSPGFLSSGHNLFRYCYGLTTITHTGVSISATDYSGMFESCTKLTSIPDTLLNWASQLDTGCNIGYMLEYCGITNIVGSAYVKINYCAQTFNFSQCKTFGPTLNIELVNPKDAYLAFNCSALTTIKIGNMGNGNWTLDGTATGGTNNGGLTGLDAESVAYLMNHLMTNEDTETKWQLRCPSSWKNKITADMITAAVNKGWQIYIGGTLQT